MEIVALPVSLSPCGMWPSCDGRFEHVDPPPCRFPGAIGVGTASRNPGTYVGAEEGGRRWQWGVNIGG